MQGSFCSCIRYSISNNGYYRTLRDAGRSSIYHVCSDQNVLEGKRPSNFGGVSRSLVVPTSAML
eukprot:5598806-Pleurochrysis_carterae.AAC.1